jgi:hypothetical protein
MTVKLVLTRNGETLISDVQEMVIGEEGDQKVIGYYLTKPCIMILNSSNERKNDSSSKLDIKLYPWMPLSKQEKIPVVVDWVITLVDPIDSLAENYVKAILENDTKERPAISIDESVSFTDSD